MAQTGYTPISIFSSATASAVPLAANLVQGELAINTADGRLFYKDSAGVVQTMASKATGAIGGSTTQVQFNSSGALAGSANLTFNGTTLTAGGFAGPGTGLSGTAASLSIGGNAANVTGTVAIANGGTGASTLAGANIPVTNVANTFTGLQTFAGTSSNADLKTSNIVETNTVSATAASGTIQYDITTQSVLYYTSNASANWTVNFRGSSGTSLNTVMQTGESISVTFLATQGATAYYNSAVTIDGNSVTPKWQGGSAPTSGNASSIDSYNYVIIKTGSAAFTVLASVTKFA